MSTPTDQLLEAYKVAVDNMKDCADNQARAINEYADKLKKNHVRTTLSPAAQGMQPSNSPLAEAGEIEALRGLIEADLEDIRDAVLAKYEARVGSRS